MNIQQIKFWRKTLDFDSGEYPQISNQDLDVVDFLIDELEKSHESNKKNKCSSCLFWEKSSETGFGFCPIGKDYFLGSNKCEYGTWKLNKEGEEL
ncbi:MAG TPA: hypothetical protein HPP54_04195 [Nitrospinae bacterium]|nr:hypothetical protein [Nitrospinota bacterium]